MSVIEIAHSFVDAQIVAIDGSRVAIAFGGDINKRFAERVVGGDFEGTGIPADADLEGIVVIPSAVGANNHLIVLREFTQVEIGNSGGGVLGEIVAVHGIGRSSDGAVGEIAGTDAADGGLRGTEDANQWVGCRNVSGGGEVRTDFIKASQEPAAINVGLVDIAVQEELDPARADIAHIKHGIADDFALDVEAVLLDITGSQIGAVENHAGVAVVGQRENWSARLCGEYQAGIAQANIGTAYRIRERKNLL